MRISDWSSDVCSSDLMAAHGGVIPYDATFLIFSDYMRPPMRLAALMRLHVVHVFTHDSIALGEDGPTHQPVEQLAGLRSVPELQIGRASCRDRVCQYVLISVVDVSLKKKIIQITITIHNVTYFKFIKNYF